MTHITSIVAVRGEENSYRAEYEDELGDRGYIIVAAKDELEAFTVASKVLEGRSMTVRVFIVSAAVVLLAMLSGLTYGCNKSSRDMETCLKVGKSYVAENQGFSCR